jgi:hypothetical protein
VLMTMGYETRTASSSDEQIDRDIDALRRDSQPYLAASSNGDTPGAAQSIDDRVRRETYEHMYKVLTASDAERKSVTRREERTEPIKVASFPC